jgi:pimeloyl-ACP methyl ester carboxylesterase
MKVMILPGMTSPYSQNAKHRSAYGWLLSELKTRLGDVTLHTYPGQVDVNGIIQDDLRSETSLKSAMTAISKSDELVHLVCCSYGTTVGAALAVNKPELIKSAFFWGALPFWTAWEEVVLANGQKTYGDAVETRGVKVTTGVFDGMVPFESCVQRIPKIPCRIAVGSKDEFIDTRSLDYYSALTRNQVNVKCVVIADCAHTVEPTQKGAADYLGSIVSFIERVS